MMSTFISAVCMGGLALVGILTMTRVVSLEQAMNASGRAFLLLVTALLALCMVKGFLMTEAIAALFFLKPLMVWLAIIAVSIVSAMLVARICISKSEKGLPGRGNHHRGEP